LIHKRRYERFIRRLETEFSAEGKNYRGISSDFSCGGLYIRTNHAFAPGTILDMTIYLPDGTASKAKGIVRRALKTPVVSLKNGMGVQITEGDANYTRFLKEFLAECGKISEEKPQAETQEAHARETSSGGAPESMIIPCQGCGVKNKVDKTRISSRPKCGKCGAYLSVS
jgi:hypothetical protein